MHRSITLSVLQVMGMQIFVNETPGISGEQALILVKEVGRQMAEVSKELKAHTLRRSYVSPCRSPFSEEAFSGR